MSTSTIVHIADVPALRERTHLPVIVDPSHVAGRRSLVLPLSLAAVGAGADGLIVEVYPEPSLARCDAEQALETQEFGDDLRKVRSAARVLGRRAPEPAPVAVPSPLPEYDVSLVDAA